MSKFQSTLIIFAMIVIGVAGYGHSQKFTCPAEGTLAYVVQEGDDIWSIAERFCSGNIQNATYYIVEKYGSVIYPGQQINLP